jgi:hypothetical protein
LFRDRYLTSSVGIRFGGTEWNIHNTAHKLQLDFRGMQISYRKWALMHSSAPAAMGPITGSRLVADRGIVHQIVAYV